MRKNKQTFDAEAEPRSKSPKAQVRRALIKGIGIAFVGVLTPITQSAIGLELAQEPPSVAPNQINGALKIAANSDLLMDILAEINGMGFGFDIALKDVKRRNVIYASQNGDRLGIALQNIDAPDPRWGGCLILTVNPQIGILETVQFIFTSSNTHNLQTTAHIFSNSQAPIRRIYGTREKYELSPVRSRRIIEFEYVRQDARTLDPEEYATLVNGFPIEVPKFNYWHFAGLREYTWSIVLGTPALYGVQVSEIQSKSPYAIQSFALNYPPIS